MHALLLRPARRTTRSWLVQQQEMFLHDKAIERACVGHMRPPPNRTLIQMEVPVHVDGWQLAVLLQDGGLQQSLLVLKVGQVASTCASTNPQVIPPPECRNLDTCTSIGHRRHGMISTHGHVCWQLKRQDLVVFKRGATCCNNN